MGTGPQGRLSPQLCGVRCPVGRPSATHRRVQHYELRVKHRRGVSEESWADTWTPSREVPRHRPVLSP